MLKELSIFTMVFERFREYLYLVVFKKDTVSFKKLGKAPDYFIVLKAIEFLDYNGIPIMEALVYYNYMYPKASFQDKLKNLVLKEFYRIEHKIECNYIPF